MEAVMGERLIFVSTGAVCIAGAFGVGGRELTPPPPLRNKRDTKIVSMSFTRFLIQIERGRKASYLKKPHGYA
jgi:hypothetical protein